MDKTLTYAPISLFVYNRPWHTKQVVEALQRCELSTASDLYIFADGPKEGASNETKDKIIEVRKYLHSINGFRSIHFDEAETNRGCANSIIYGVSKVIKQFGKAIVVEDDIVTHPFFLRFMNEALDFYENDKRIFCISATMENFTIPQDYKYDVFLTHRTGSWGWATWNDRWESVDWNMDNYPIITCPTKKRIKQLCQGGDDLWLMLNMQLNGEIDAWDIRYLYNMVVQKKLCLRPTESLVTNIGMDGSGTHCGGDGANLLPLYNEKTYNINLIQYPKLNNKITHNIQAIFSDDSRKAVSLWKRTKRHVKRLIRFTQK